MIQVYVDDSIISLGKEEISDNELLSFWISIHWCSLPCPHIPQSAVARIKDQKCEIERRSTTCCAEQTETRHAVATNLCI